MTSSGLRKLCKRVLRQESRKGRTTKHDCVLEAMRCIQSSGGHGSIGLGKADLILAMKHLVGKEFDLQFKVGLPDNTIHQAFRNAPPEIVQVLPKLPAWIAISEGGKAVRIPSLAATPDDWMANARLKEKKGRQTTLQGHKSQSISLLLLEHGCGSLSEFSRETSSIGV